MNAPFPSVSAGIAQDRTLVLVAARRRREARDAGEPTQPRLAEALARYGRALLAPVLDSLLLFYEVALARPMRCGRGPTASPDELRLLSLLEGRLSGNRLKGPASAVTVLDCALASARIMLASTREPIGQGAA